MPGLPWRIQFVLKNDKEGRYVFVFFPHDSEHVELDQWMYYGSDRIRYKIFSMTENSKMVTYFSNTKEDLLEMLDEKTLTHISPDSVGCFTIERTANYLCQC
jgi:hypothetical protein